MILQPITGKWLTFLVLNTLGMILPVNTILRLYGPLEPWFDKTWIPGDPVEVK